MLRLSPLFEKFVTLAPDAGDLCEVGTRRTGAAFDFKAVLIVSVVGPAQIDLTADSALAARLLGALGNSRRY